MLGGNKAVGINIEAYGLGDPAINVAGAGEFHDDLRVAVDQVSRNVELTVNDASVIGGEGVQHGVTNGERDLSCILGWQWGVGSRYVQIHGLRVGPQAGAFNAQGDACARN